MHTLKNAPTASGPTPLKEPEFADFATAAHLLQSIRGDSEIGLVTENNTNKLLVKLSEQAPDSEDVKQLSDLLSIPRSRKNLVFDQSFHALSTEDLTIQTRSLMGAMYYLSQNVRVPERHIKEGRVTVTRTEDGKIFDWGDVLSDIFTVRSRLTEPGNASVKVHYRGTWFYIDDFDLSSKTTFALLSQLFSLQAGEIQNLAPALTISLGN